MADLPIAELGCDVVGELGALVPFSDEHLAACCGPLLSCGACSTAPYEVGDCALQVGAEGFGVIRGRGEGVGCCVYEGVGALRAHGSRDGLQHDAWSLRDERHCVIKHGVGQIAAFVRDCGNQERNVGGIECQCRGVVPERVHGIVGNRVGAESRAEGLGEWHAWDLVLACAELDDCLSADDVCKWSRPEACKTGVPGNVEGRVELALEGGSNGGWGETVELMSGGTGSDLPEGRTGESHGGRDLWLLVRRGELMSASHSRVHVPRTI